MGGRGMGGLGGGISGGCCCVRGLCGMLFRFLARFIDEGSRHLPQAIPY